MASAGIGQDTRVWRRTNETERLKQNTQDQLNRLVQQVHNTSTGLIAFLISLLCIMTQFFEL